MTWWILEGLLFSGGLGTILWSASEQSQCRWEGGAGKWDPEQSGHQEAEWVTSWGHLPAQFKPFCLFFSGKDPSIRWVDEQGDPFTIPFQPRAYEMEREAGPKEKAEMSKCQVFIITLNEIFLLQGIAINLSFSQGGYFWSILLIYIEGTSTELRQLRHPWCHWYNKAITYG